MKKNLSVSKQKKSKSYVYSDNVEKNYYLNKCYLTAEYNKNLINSLNNIYSNYKINIRDPIIENNLRDAGHKRLFLLKNKLQNSLQLLKNFDNIFIFKRLENNKNISESDLIINKKDNQSLNISNIKKKTKKSKFNKLDIDIINKKQKVNNIKCYSAKTPSNRSIYLKKRKTDELYTLINNNFKKIKKIEKLSNLHEKIDTFMKNIKNETNIFKTKKEQKRPKSHYTRNKNINKNIIPTYRKTSSAFYRTNETTINKNNINKINKISFKSNYDKTNNSTSISQYSSNLKYYINSPFSFSTRNKNNSKYILSKRACETSREIKKISFKSIIEANKINHKIKKNFKIYKIPKIYKKNKSSNDLLNDKFMDLKGIRKELKLKDSNGLLCEINEIDLLEKDLKKMGERLSKKYMNILSPIARGLIRQDLLLNKRLIYNVGIEHCKGRKKYFKLYDTLNNLRNKKRLVEDFIIN